MAAKTEISNFSIDCVIFGFDKGELKALLIKRNTEPDFGKLGLPGGFVYLDEDLDAAPIRRLHELTGLTDIYMKQVGTFGKTDRYPIRRVITVVYYALVRVSDYSMKIGEDALELHWVPVNQMPELTFDHNDLFNAALTTLQEQVRIDPIIFNLLPKDFSLSDLQIVYETVTMQKFDKRNFRKKILNLGILHDTGKKQNNVSHRAARLYRFDKKAYQKMLKRGQMFAI
ncbi:MAG: NUDIX domain-containing protein [Bacteroidales bacterium]|nr:NUDIX domain-containing protein [Bacteroidales bacterium]